MKKIITMIILFGTFSFSCPDKNIHNGVEHLINHHGVIKVEKRKMKVDFNAFGNIMGFVFVTEGHKNGDTDILIYSFLFPKENFFKNAENMLTTYAKAHKLKIEDWDSDE